MLWFEQNASHSKCPEKGSVQLETQRRTGRLHAQAQQIQYEELFELQNIAEDLSDMQVLPSLPCLQCLQYLS